MTTPRPLLSEIYMRFAVDLAQRSTCDRTKVGAVITTDDFTQVLAIGYNGNARGMPNECDTDEPGACGCVHAESNAIAKCGGGPNRSKVLFVTLSPCVLCAKLVVNSGFRRVYYHTQYRSLDGLEVLDKCGVEVVWLKT